jgi:hypothetical protein
MPLVLCISSFLCEAPANCGMNFNHQSLKWLNCVLLSNYLQEVLVGQSPQVICVLHGNQTNFLFIFFSPPNAKFQTDSILRS